MPIEVIGDAARAPDMICPYCKQPVKLTIEAFVPDITKVVRSNCPRCGGEIFAAVLVMANTNLRALLSQIQSVIEFHQKSGANVATLDNPGKGAIT